MRKLNEIIIIAVLLLLAIINLVFFLVSMYFGPIIGILFPIIVLIKWGRKKDSVFIIGIAFIWILLHIYELIVYVECTYPIFLYLNILLPIPLLYCGIKENSSMKRGQSKE